MDLNPFVIDEESLFEMTIKRSLFIGRSFKVFSEEEARDHIQRIRKEYKMTEKNVEYIEEVKEILKIKRQCDLSPEEKIELLVMKRGKSTIFRKLSAISSHC